MSHLIQPKELKVVFDLDDTLIMTMVKFNRAAFECGGIVMNALGWYSAYAPQILDLQQRIDVEFTERYGFGPRKYVACWLETYRLLCEEQALIPSDDVGHRLQRAAMKPFIGSSEVVPGAFSTLEAVKDLGYELYMCTIGDKNVQLTKVLSSGLGRYFPETRVFVVSPSKSEVLAQIAADTPERTVMIGDSKKSDITVAQQLGIHAVYVSCPTQWTYNDMDESVLGPYWAPFGIRGVPDVLSRICRGETP